MMAKCEICDGEMLEVKGCNNHLYVMGDDKKVKPVRVGEGNDFTEEGERCGDCSAAYGETHHVGCDVERCRVCGGQFIYCDCDYSDKILILK